MRGVVALVGLFVLGLGCSHGKAARPKPDATATGTGPAAATRFERPAPPEPAAMPAWVTLGSGAFVSEKYGDAFFGVGSSVNPDAAAAGGEAAAAARLELAKVVGTLLLPLSDQYAAKYARDQAGTRRTVLDYAGRVVLGKMIEQLGPAAAVEQQPRMEGRNMSILLAPKHGGG